MWFIIIYSLLAITVLPAHAAVTKENHPIVPKPTEYELKKMSAAKQNRFSNETEIRALLTETRSKLFADNKNYENSWLHDFEKLLDAYAKAAIRLKQFQNEIETKRIGKMITVSVGTVDTNKKQKYRLPSDETIQVSRDQFNELDKTVSGMIDNLDDQCLGANMKTISEEFGKKSFDENELKIRIGASLTNIEEILPRLEQVSKEFNYQDYFNALNTMNDLQLMFDTKFGSPKPMFDKLNVDFNKAYPKIKIWFDENSPTINKIKDASKVIQTPRQTFMDKMKSTFPNFQTVSTTSLSLSQQNLRKWNMNLMRDLTAKIRSSESKLKEYLGEVKRFYDYSFSAISLLEKLKQKTLNVETIKYYHQTVDGQLFEIPSSTIYNEFIANRQNMIETVQNAYDDMISVCFDAYANAFYNPILSIDPNIEINDDQLIEIGNFVEAIRSYNDQITDASFDTLLLSRYIRAARSAQSAVVLDQLEVVPVKVLTEQLNEMIVQTMKSSNTQLMKSIEPLNQLISNILFAHNKLLGYINRILGLTPKASTTNKRKSVTIEHLGSIRSDKFDHLKFAKMIYEKTLLISDANSVTKSNWMKLKELVDLAFDMYDQLNLNWIRLKQDSTEPLEPVHLQRIDGNVENYPNAETLNEIQNKRKNLIEKMELCLKRLKPFCNSDVIQSIFDMMKKFRNGRFVQFDHEIDLSSISKKYDEFKKIINPQTISSFQNPISELNKLKGETDSKPIPYESYEETKSRVAKLMADLKTANVDILKVIDEADEMINEMKIIDVYTKVYNEIEEKMPNEAYSSDDETFETPVKVSTKNMPNKSILKPHDPPLTSVSGREPIEPTDSDDDSKSKKGKKPIVVDKATTTPRTTRFIEDIEPPVSLQATGIPAAGIVPRRDAGPLTGQRGVQRRLSIESEPVKSDQSKVISREASTIPVGTTEQNVLPKQIDVIQPIELEPIAGPSSVGPSSPSKALPPGNHKLKSSLTNVTAISNSSGRSTPEVTEQPARTSQMILQEGQQDRPSTPCSHHGIKDCLNCRCKPQ